MLTRSLILALLFTTNLYAGDVALRLPYPDGVGYRCTQANNDTPSHNINSTRYDLDFAMPYGKTVVAAAAGTAHIYFDRNEHYYSGFGYHIKIDHGDGVHTVYAHLSKSLIDDEQFVYTGQPIGKSGGRNGSIGSGVSTNPHLHFGLHSGDASSPDETTSTESRIIGTDRDGWSGWFIMSRDFKCDESSTNKNGHTYISANPDTSKIGGCGNFSGTSALCWSGSESCKYADTYWLFNGWTIYTEGDYGFICENLTNIVTKGSEIAKSIQDASTSFSGVGGPGAPTPPDDSGKKKVCVNFITTETRLYDRATGEEQYEFEPGESIRGKAWYQNIGSCDPSDDPKRIPSLVLLSKGYKEDSHSKWKPVDDDTTKYYHLEAGDDPHDEKYSFSAPLREGVYNAVFCIDRDKPKGNGDGEVKEIHKSDNCSTETVFTVKRGPVTETPDAKLVWSPNGEIAGMVCTQVWERQEPLDHGWDNNYLCSDADYGIVFSDLGKIDGMRCTATGEGADPHGWDDRTNYLCLPETVEGFDEFSFSWTATGAIDGRTCVQWTEPQEPRGHRWDDNFLCYSAKKTPPPEPPVCEKPNLNAGQASGTTDYDYMIDHVGADTTILSAGQTWHPTAIACSNTVAGEEIDTRIGYYLSPCEDGSQAWYLDDDGVDEDNYDISGCSAERINVGASAPSTPGRYMLTVCADYQKTVTENNEGNNCNWLEVEVR